jgi:hypothetical protein
MNDHSARTTPKLAPLNAARTAQLAIPTRWWCPDTRVLYYNFSVTVPLETTMAFGEIGTLAATR